MIIQLFRKGRLTNDITSEVTSKKTITEYENYTKHQEIDMDEKVQGTAKRKRA